MHALLHDKLKGILYGVAIGDAFGATTEFMTSDEIQSKYDTRLEIIGEGWLRLLPGEVTDPTESMLCLYHISAKSYDTFLNQCCEALIQWHDRHPVDIEECCKHVIQKCRNTSYPTWIHYSQNLPTYENSNLFRSIPLILSERRPLNKNTSLLLAQSRLTHNNDVCDTCLLDYRQMLFKCLNNEKIPIDAETKLLPRHRDIRYTLRHAIYHFASTHSFEAAILDSVKYGGDTDAIAALTGSFAGARYGYQSIPKRWIAQLNPNVKEALDDCLHSIAQKNAAYI